MQKIDPAFLYDLGSSIRDLRELTPQSTQITGYVVMITASDAIKKALDQSIYAFAFRHPTRVAALELTNTINEMTNKIEGNAETWDSSAMDSSDIQRLQRLYVRFETCFWLTYRVLPSTWSGRKGGMTPTL